ncbi:MAG: class I SAM-dependent rRNA methyltransferase [Alphaproteobacteria bacterium]|nr:class I SAM-dependent rRNA methyltransferase [Alphaproteobacteria bacterium]
MNASTATASAPSSAAPSSAAPSSAALGSGARPVVRLQPQRHKRVRLGHPWAFSNEIEMTAAAKTLPPGGVVTLVDAVGAPLGVATFNPHTLIAARIYDRDPVREIDRAFVAERLERARALRDRLYPEGCYRLVHAEADGLPGLVVDRYGAVVVLQLNSAGSDRLREAIIAAVHDVLAPAAIVLRNDSTARTLEGLGQEVAVVHGAIDDAIAVVENGVTFFCDPLGGQKTGWFFDQRENRALCARLAAGRRVLDLYSYLGGFGLTAAAAGAAEVVCVDRSEPALALAARAAARNGLADRVGFVRAEAFADTERRAAAGERFDLVIADPPAFVKSKKDLAAGAKGYRKLARRAASLVAPGGSLFIASCSHHMVPAMLTAEVARALSDARRTGRILYAGGAAPDHPVHPMLPESAYLKFLLLALD